MGDNALVRSIMSNDKPRGFLDADRIKDAAAGRWLSIFDSLAPALHPALSRKIGRHGPCPVHGGKDGFRFFKDADQDGGGVSNQDGTFSNGISLLMWVNGWEYRETLEAIAVELGILDDVRNQKPVVRTPPPRVKESRKTDEHESAHLRQKLQETFEKSYSIMHPASEPARYYLAGRGLAYENLPETVVRMALDHPYYEEDDQVDGKINLVGRYPTILLRVDDKDGKPVTLHRIYLDQSGNKANVESPKKLMAYPKEDYNRLLGGAIRLTPYQGNVLGVAEGAETAMSCTMGSGIPTWSCVFADLLAGFVPPDDITMVVVWADKDRSGKGQDSARKLVARLRSQGILAVLLIPGIDIPANQKSIDWNDMWIMFGHQAFPGLEQMKVLAIHQSKR